MFLRLLLLCFGVYATNHAELEGAVEQFATSNYKDGVFKTLTFLNSGGQQFFLQPHGEFALALETGQTIRLESDHIVKRSPGTPLSSSGETLTIQNATVLNPKFTASAGVVKTRMDTVALLLINMQDSDLECDADQVSDVFWSTDLGSNPSVRHIFERNSFGAVTFAQGMSGTDVYGPYDIPFGSGGDWTCVPSSWADAADAQAIAAGVPLDRYMHRIYVLPYSEAFHTMCGWNGFGNVGCTYSCRSWINNCDNAYVYAHELGHNFGLQHANGPSASGTVRARPSAVPDNQGFFH
jgi:hypothetical protein